MQIRESSRLENLGVDDFSALTDDEIEKLSRTWCFDGDASWGRLSRGDAWHKVLLAHLFYDHVLTALIEDGVSDPKPLQLDRMAFSAKLSLGQALNLVPESSVPYFKAVNRLRNSIAHDLAFRIKKEHVDELENRCPKGLKELVRTSKRDRGQTRLFWILAYPLIWMELHRQRLVAQRIESKKLSLEVARVASEIRKRQNLKGKKR